MKKPKSNIKKRGSTVFLRVTLFAIAAAVLAICIFALPATWLAVADEYPSHTYVFYSIITAMYVAAVPFYIALYQALKLLSYIDKNKAFSELSVKALKRIAYDGVAIGLIYTAVLPFFYIWAEYDDAPGLILVDVIIIGAAFTVSVFAGVVQMLLRQAIDMKSENDLTV